MADVRAPLCQVGHPLESSGAGNAVPNGSSSRKSNQQTERSEDCLVMLKDPSYVSSRDATPPSHPIPPDPTRSRQIPPRSRYLLLGAYYGHLLPTGYRC